MFDDVTELFLNDVFEKDIYGKKMKNELTRVEGRVEYYITYLVFYFVVSKQLRRHYVAVL